MPERLAIPTPEVASQTADVIEGTRQTATAASNMDFSILGLFMEAGVVVQLVILALVLASFWSWAIIFEKIFIYYKITKKMNNFESEVWNGKSLDGRYEKVKHIADHPLERVFVAGMYEWRLSNYNDGNQSSFSLEPSGLLAAGAALSKPQEVKEAIKDRVLSTMDLSRNRELRYLEKNLPFLATVGSSSPFVGLFGTVWGIMTSFQAIAAYQNATLAVVAPGIAEALFATAIGLFAAIPSVIFYNKFSNQAASVGDRIDNFTDEFIAEVSRTLDK